MDALQQILEDMQALESNDDYEVAHGDADGLLLMALEALATEENQAVIESIIDAYENVGKWYA